MTETGAASGAVVTSGELACKCVSASKCERCRERIVADSFLLTAAGLVLKLILGLMCGSQAVLADAIHSLMDTIAFGVNYAGADVASRFPRAAPYRQKIVIGCLILTSGVWLCASNAALLICGSLVHPGLTGLVLAAASVVANHRLHKRSSCLRRQTNDPDVVVCAVQNRTNYWASWVSLGGVLLTELGVMVADPLSAFIIGTLLVGSAFAVFNEGFAARPATGGWRKRAVMRTAAALSFAIMGFFAVRVYATMGRSDVILVPAQGPTLASPADSVLGRAEYFVIVDRRKQVTTPLVNTNRFLQGDVSIGLIATVKAYDVDVVLAEKVGTEMFKDLVDAHVRIYYFEGTPSVERAVSDFAHDRLTFARGPNVSRKYGMSGIGWLQPW
jgi:predicted Fe-Mo cluster-binding NifX family protein